MTDDDDSLSNFLKSSKKCIKCQSGPTKFTINWDELKQEYYSKWGDYCSQGCVIDLPSKKLEF